MADESCEKRKWSKTNSKTHINQSEQEDDNSRFNTENNLKRKLSRKDARKEVRAQKKAKRNAHFQSKNDKHKETTQLSTEQCGSDLAAKKEMINVKKKKKKKRKPKSRDKEIKDVSTIRAERSRKIFEEEDEELKDLEKKLKLNKKANLPKAFYEEGLEDIINVCDAIESGSLNRQAMSPLSDQEEDIYDDVIEDETYQTGEDASDEYVDDSEDDDNKGETGNTLCGNIDSHKESQPQEECDDAASNNNTTVETAEDMGDEEGSLYNEGEIDQGQEKCVKSSSYDIYGGAVPKYVPPHQRKQNTERSKVIRHVNERLTKLVQGLLNRLSESNLSGVTSQIEELYMSNSRNDVNEVFTKLLMDVCISSSLMPDGLLREHTMLVALLNSRIGSEVGAFLLQKLAAQFHQLHSFENESNEGKELHNIVTLFALLYSFKVIDCVLVYDIIRRLVGSFSEKDIELLLLLIRLIGVEIRRESPESLKEIILQVQSKAAADAELSNTSRTRFMLETINALRNNNIRKIPNYDPAPLERARKILKNIGQDDNTKLTISLSDLLTANEKGRWWIVGSAWSEREKSSDIKSASVIWKTTDNSDVLELARQQRMSTDIRKNIFCTIMTSEDYVDAFEKLLRMKLKSKQSREIIYVLMDCSLQEKSYNPFYSYLIQKFCEFSRNYQVTVQYSLWDRFKMASTLTDLNLSNMAHLLVHVLVNKSLSLSVLKVVDFTTLDKKLLTFFTQMLTRLLLDYQENTVRDVFMRISPLAKLDPLKESLKLFMKHFLKSKRSKPESGATVRTENKEKLDERITLAIEALTPN